MEAGTTNYFAVAACADGGVEVGTPPLDETILPGITRNAVLVLLGAHGARANSPARTATNPARSLDATAQA
ncbi:hypothetical protein B0H15DRAFT_7704 [Mycena belliarum]|uniref:Uncharacterized protein n=1 Tax=Mycena belliarum TaxID=1033014 RepID=A0AAD6UMX3_9AGAR|nr:hypothetical protein B0H15DRAFT_7704 [Mycena belliae]